MAGTEGAGTGGASASGGKAGDTSSSGGLAGTQTGGGIGGSSSAGTTSGGDGGEPATEETDAIDDMEDDDAQIDQSGGRNGYWYVGSDGTTGATTVPATGKFAMAALPAGDRSKFAAGLKATNFTGWGSDIGFNVVEMLGNVVAYDASQYCGVQFWGKAAASVGVRFRMPDGDTHPAGKVCTDPGGAGTACYDHFGVPVTFATTWKSFEVKFTDLFQAGTGYHPAEKKFKPNELYALEWALPGGAAKTYESGSTTSRS